MVKHRRRDTEENGIQHNNTQFRAALCRVLHFHIVMLGDNGLRVFMQNAIMSHVVASKHQGSI